jgi:hypothetical protein
MYNLLTTLVAGVTLFMCVGMSVIFLNPEVFFNPFKPSSAATLPVVVTVAPIAATAVPVSTVRAPVAATKTASPSPTVTAPGGGTATGTPFPSPVGPTDTSTPTQIPTQTPTLRQPAASATSQSYPGGATEPPTSTSRPPYP